MKNDINLLHDRTINRITRIDLLELLIENRERDDLKIDFNGSAKKYFANKRSEMYNFFLNNVYLLLFFKTSDNFRKTILTVLFSILF